MMHGTASEQQYFLVIGAMAGNHSNQGLRNEREGHSSILYIERLATKTCFI